MDEQQHSQLEEQTYRSKCRMVLIALNCSLSSFYIGYCLVYMGAMPFETIVNVFGIVMEENAARGMLNGVVMIGAIIGALSSFLLFLNFSRRNCLLIVNVLAFVIGILVLVEKFEVLLFARLCQGLCVGLYSSLVPMYLNQISPLELSGTLGSYFQLMITVGIFVGTFLPYVMTKLSGDHSGASFWPLIFVFPQIGVIAQSLTLIFVFPYQTPKYLISVGAREEAKHLLSTIYQEKYVDKVYEQKIMDYLTVTGQNCSSREKQDQGKTIVSEQGKSIYKNRIPQMLAIHLTVLQQFSGINTIIVYGSVIAKEAVTGELAELTASLINLQQIIATLISGYLLSQLGRKTILVWGTLAEGICCLLMTFGFFLKFSLSLERLGSLLILLGLFAFIAVYGLSLGPLVWIYIKQVVQPSFIPVTTGLNWGLAAVIVIFFPTLINRVLLGQPQLLFLFFGLWCLLSGVVNAYYLVQTKGRSEKQILQKFDDLKIC